MKVYFDDGIVQGYTDHEEKRIHYFGAWQLQDWFQVLKVWQKPYWRGLVGVHWGFSNLANRAIKMLEVDRNYSNYTITGHSMGGAIAVLVAWYLRRYVDVSVRTAGSPRVLSPIAHWQIDSQIFMVRYINDHDPVPHFLPWLFGYRHVGNVARFLCTKKFMDAHQPVEYQKHLPWCIPTWEIEH